MSRSSSRPVRLGCDLDIEEVEENGCAWARYTYRRVAMKVKGPGSGLSISIPTQISRGAPAASRRFAALPCRGRGVLCQNNPAGPHRQNQRPAGRCQCRKGQSSQSTKRAEPVYTGHRQPVWRGLDKRELEDQLAVFPDACLVTAERAVAESPSGIEVGDTWSRSERIDEQANCGRADLAA